MVLFPYQIRLTLYPLFNMQCIDCPCGCGRRISRETRRSRHIFFLNFPVYMCRKAHVAYHHVKHEFEQREYWMNDCYERVRYEGISIKEQMASRFWRDIIPA
ncbi:hypothetical protein HGRIS_005899 [Hohenbuehelia grisea]|uniref:Uncharacterized protein n=1 Tax=Hohenbuehelia grisea TaxID=104357 RepID=A0ABR3JY70_9AGAR